MSQVMSSTEQLWDLYVDWCEDNKLKPDLSQFEVWLDDNGYNDDLSEIYGMAEPYELP